MAALCFIGRLDTPGFHGYSIGGNDQSAHERLHHTDSDGVWGCSTSRADDFHENRGRSLVTMSKTCSNRRLDCIIIVLRCNSNILRLQSDGTHAVIAGFLAYGLGPLFTSYKTHEIAVTQPIFYRYYHTETGTYNDNGSRLGMNHQCFDVFKRHVMISDPRLLLEDIEARGVQLRTFALV
ncbi:uncharacterized protein BCR38DRAFT_111288 [Pseudomassariella vexata]|uniref:Uncharacterized protein n=1 Tax=Pseudomassariella vexata TaxID=1141098 RepID=A0A1Y2DDV8_9PEZI|nr:uncharacterized protein BCR38DRAFT_111288 [Pseudomassariella vexata]ORY57306.1 hypothetical protein BCR38DRAFT_111288 [Pseudomassariella vexata]